MKSSKFLYILIGSGVVILGVCVSLVVDTMRVPDFNELRTKVTVPIKLANKEKSEREVGPKTSYWVPLSQISNPVLMAVISSEDTSFFSHSGVDFHELGEAVKKDWQEKKWARGGSTITQQLIKNVYLGKQKTLWRKFKEFFWAKEIEKVLTKSEILCFYINLVEWGPGIYGLRDASQHYFSIHPSALSTKQAAFLALLLPSPVKYHSYYEKRTLTVWASKRVGQILKVMNRMGFIDEQTYKEALAEKLWGKTGELVDQAFQENLGSEDTETNILNLKSSVKTQPVEVAEPEKPIEFKNIPVETEPPQVEEEKIQESIQPNETPSTDAIEQSP